jgi:hypothetical protein
VEQGNPLRVSAPVQSHPFKRDPPGLCVRLVPGRALLSAHQHALGRIPRSTGVVRIGLGAELATDFLAQCFSIDGLACHEISP